MIRGAYHYARPDSNSTIDEVQHFISALDRVGGLEPGDLLALDIESGSGNVALWSLNFVRDLENHYGFKPFIYTGAWFSNSAGFPALAPLAEYGLWLAAYTASSVPNPAKPWKDLAIWQYTDSARVNGIVGNVDENIFFGTKEQLRKYGYGAGTIPAPVPPPLPEFPEDRAKEYVHALRTIRDVTIPRIRDEVNELDRIVRQYVGD
jgi:lysozyme